MDTLLPRLRRGTQDTGFFAAAGYAAAKTRTFQAGRRTNEGRVPHDR